MQWVTLGHSHPQKGCSDQAYKDLYAQNRDAKLMQTIKQIPWKIRLHATSAPFDGFICYCFDLNWSLLGLWKHQQSMSCTSIRVRICHCNYMSRKRHKKQRGGLNSSKERHETWIKGLNYPDLTRLEYWQVFWSVGVCVSLSYTSHGCKSGCDCLYGSIQA